MFRLWSIWAAIFSSVLFVAGDVTNSKSYPNNKGRYNCDTRECFIDNIKYEFDLMKNMNDSVSPCENFYEYACGNFDDLPHAPKMTNHIMQSLTDMNQTLLMSMFNPYLSNKLKLLNFLRDFMIACQDVKDNNEYSNSEAKDDKLDFLKEVVSKLGGWPVLEGEKWNETDFDWTKSVRESKSIGYDSGQSFLNFFVDDTFSDSPVSFNLHPPYLEFPYISISNHRNNTLMDAYYNYMINVAKFLGANETRAKVDLLEAFEFEKQLINGTKEIGYPTTEPPASSKVDTTKNSMSLEEIARTWPSINWAEYFSNNLHPYFSVENKTLIHISNKNYITNFEKLINTTSKRIQANYAIWKIIEFSIPLIKSATLNNFKKTYTFFKQGLGASVHNCYAKARTDLSKLARAYHARSYPINSKVKHSAGQIFSDIKNKLLDTLKSDTSKSQAKEKLIKKIENLKVVFGYPDELLDDKKLEDYFEGLEITKDNHLGNSLSIQLFNQKLGLSMLSKSQDAYDWKDIFSIMNTKIVRSSYYYSRGNFIELSAVLSNFFINTNRHNYTNYGAIGAFIGFELGNVVNTPMDLGDHYLSNNIDDCILKQYSNYTGGNGTEGYSSSSLEDNIARQIGVKFAYSAYQEWAKEHGEEPKLAGLYSPNQLFWLSYANMYCSPKFWIQSTSPGYVPYDKQVIGPLSNIPEFSRDYNCLLESSMNPKNKCVIL